ncbi:MAG: hypothetical protein AAF196_20420, partial [Planctomycetota bacterium]
PEAELQSIAGLGGLLNGVYFVEAVDAAGAEVRGQITPRDVQVVRIELTEDQVIGADPVAGGSGVVFFTFDEANGLGSGATASGDGANDGNAMANNPVVVAETSFVAETVQIVVGGGFAGLEGAANRIVLSDTGSGMSFAANGPGTPEAELQSIAGLGGLQNGVYFVEAIDAAGDEVRGQILPRNTAALRADVSGAEALPPNGAGIVGAGFITATDIEAGLFVANASFSVDASDVSVNIGGNAEFVQLTDPTPGIFVSGAPQRAANIVGLLNGVYSIQADV